MKLSYTRAMIRAALAGRLEKQEFVHDDLFNLDVPKACPGVPAEILNPRNTWKDKNAYDQQALRLAEMFEKNFQEKYPDMPEEIATAGPHPEALESKAV